MKINNQTFNLNEELIVSIDQEDNDGLINIPKNINLDINNTCTARNGDGGNGL